MASEVRRITPLEVQANRFALVSRLADDLAHEIKNPLHAIVINIELIKRRAQGGDVADVLKRADFVADEVVRVNAMIDQLLQLLRPARKADPVLDLDGVLAEVMPLLEQQARLARVELGYHGIGGPAPAPILPHALKLVLLNLMADALGARGTAGGRIDVMAAYTEEGTSLTVSDAPAPEAGTSAVPGTAGSTAGAGGFEIALGLDVVRSLVEEVGGAFSTAPVSGGGTRRVVQFGRTAPA